jgi:predicted DCC family thiol-disulfide oxidoreductase YuxK
MPAVVLFDGVCNFCNSTVSFIIKRDPAGYFRFAALQSELAERILADYRLPSGPVKNIVLVEQGACYTRSTAALRILRRLRGPLVLLYVLVLVPRSIRDAAYDWFARHRYGWFGKRSEYFIPSPEIRSRFLE